MRVTTKGRRTVSRPVLRTQTDLYTEPNTLQRPHSQNQKQEMQKKKALPLLSPRAHIETNEAASIAISLRGQAPAHDVTGHTRGTHSDHPFGEQASCSGTRCRRRHSPTPTKAPRPPRHPSPVTATTSRVHRTRGNSAIHHPGQRKRRVCTPRPAPSALTKKDALPGHFFFSSGC